MDPKSQLLKINKNEYLAQQKSKLEDALKMGLTKDEYDLICKKINKTIIQTVEYKTGAKIRS